MQHQPHVEAHLLDVKAVAEFYRVSPRTVWDLSAAGRIPAPIRISPRTIRWRMSDLIEHVQQMQTASEPSQPVEYWR